MLNTTKTFCLLITTLLFSFISLHLFAQDGTTWKEAVASYQEVLDKNLEDTATVIALYELTREYMWEDPDKGIDYGTKALEMAQKINWKKGEGNSYVNMGFAYRGKKDYEKAAECYNDALAIFEEIDDKVGVAKIFNEKAYLAYILSDIEKAKKYLTKAYQLETKIGNKARAARAISSIGIMHGLQDNYPMALEAYEKALLIQETLKDSSNMGTTLVSIGEIYLKTKDYSTATKYFKRVLTLSRHIPSFAHSNVSLGTIARINKDYPASLEYYNYGIHIFEKSKDFRQVAYINNFQGMTYSEMGDLNKALELHQKALKTYKDVKSKPGIAETKLLISQILQDKGSSTEAIALGNEALAIAQEIKDVNHQADAHKALATYYEKTGNTKKAFENYKSHILFRDSIFNEQKTKELTQTAMKYDFARTQMADSLAFQQERFVLENNVQNERKGRFWMIGLSLILGLLFFQSYKNAQSKKRTNKALVETNKLLDVKNHQNEVLLKEIHHRVKNNLQTISSLLSLQSNSIEDQGALDAVQESQNRVTSMALIHQKLYQGENLAAIEMRDYFETIGKAIFNSFGEKAKGVELEVDMSEIELDVDTAIPIGLITNELITNSLKYAFKEKTGGKISIAMKKVEDNLIELKIADNGKNESSGVSEGGTGFGSMLVNLLTTQLGGKIEQSTTQGTSTLIQFSLKNKAA